MADGYSSLSSLNWGTSTGGAAGSAETTLTLGVDRLDVRAPPDQYHSWHAQLSACKNLLIAMSSTFKGGTRLGLLPQTSNPFGAAESGLYMDTSGNAYKVFNGAATSLAGGGSSLAIGSAVTSGTANNQLYVDPSGNLAQQPLTPPTFKVVLSSPYTNAGAQANPYLFMLPMWVPPGTTRVRVTLANRNNSGGLYAGVARGDTTTDLAVGTLNNSSNGWSGSPTVVSSFAVNAIGSRSNWINVTRNSTTGKIGIAAYLPSGQQFAYELQNYGYVNANSTDVTGLSGISANTAGGIPLAVTVEYETTAPRFVFFGDSLSRGEAGSGYPIAGYEAAFAQLGPTYGYAINAAGVGGSMMIDFAEGSGAFPIARGFFRDMATIKGATVNIAFGVNDLNTTTDNVIDYAGRAIEKVRAYGPKEVWLATIPPFNATVVASAYRAEYNNWVRSAPYGVDYVWDWDLILRDPATPTQLLSSYNAGDGHLTAAGYTALISQAHTDGKF